MRSHCPWCRKLCGTPSSCIGWLCSICGIRWDRNGMVEVWIGELPGKFEDVDRLVGEWKECPNLCLYVRDIL